MVYFKYDITTGFTGSGRFYYKNNYDLYCVGDWKCIVPRNFFAVYRHLKRNKDVIYKEDLEKFEIAEERCIVGVTEDGNKKETKKEKIMQVIDVFFVMILCFVVLLVTMLFQNLAGVKEAGKAYVIQASTLVPVVVALTAYVTFLVKRSKKDLKEIIELEYSEKEQEQV